ncbi:DUF2905 domain-containing protein [Nitratifractor sp.]
MGKVLIVTGLILIVAGIAVHYGLFDWFGRLPGDIRYEGENVRFYAPITSMLILSLILSFLLWWCHS